MSNNNVEKLTLIASKLGLKLTYDCNYKAKMMDISKPERPMIAEQLQKQLESFKQFKAN